VPGSPLSLFHNAFNDQSQKTINRLHELRQIEKSPNVKEGTMKFNTGRTLKISIFVAICGAILIACDPTVFGQDDIQGRKLFFGVKPLVGDAKDLATIREQSNAGTGLKMWGYSVKSTRTGPNKGKTFTGVMVGNSPLTTNGTTTTTVYVVPIVLHIGGVTFSPTAADASCLGGKVPLTVLKQSPMVLPHSFTLNGVSMGTVQYSDAFQRANFWTKVLANGGTYHNKLNYVFLPAISVTPGSSHSVLFSISGSPCRASYGGVEINWFDSLITGKIIPSLKSKGIGPTNLPVFMLYNTTMYNGTSSNCCIGGYHGAFGSPAQTYSPFQFDSVGVFGVGSEDTDIMAHEVNEWQDDPLGNNATPPWGKVGQVSGCQNNLEVGDPVTGKNVHNVTMNGSTYHLQELAYFSWFFGPPSMGPGGKFSDNGTFTTAQGPCNGK
jgi:hypothetical protein